MLKVKLADDFKNAMLEKDRVRKVAVQMIKAAVLNFEKDTKRDAEDVDVLEIISKELKKRKDSLVSIEKSGREDLISDLKREMEILAAYLPEQMSPEEITSVVKEAIGETNATSIKDMGKVMGLVTQKVKGKADNKLVSDIVRQLLS